MTRAQAQRKINSSFMDNEDLGDAMSIVVEFLFTDKWTRGQHVAFVRAAMFSLSSVALNDVMKVINEARKELSEDERREMQADYDDRNPAPRENPSGL